MTFPDGRAHLTDFPSPRLTLFESFLRDVLIEDASAHAAWALARQLNKTELETAVDIIRAVVAEAKSYREELVRIASR